MKNKKLISLFFVLILISCEPNNPEIEYKTGYFPELPVNFQDINSEFDDYNSNLLIIDYRFLLSFSSNRETEGGTFDFRRETVRFIWSQVNGTFHFSQDTVNYSTSQLELLIDSANSPYNEFGPYTFGYRYPDNCFTHLFLYSSDIQGDFDIYFSYSNDCTDYINNPLVSHAQKISFIDSSANELYPSFYGEDLFFHDGWANSKPTILSKMIYCSDKEGQYDIYEVEIDSGPDIKSSLAIHDDRVSKYVSINSSMDDKCPYVNGKLLVFTSNRPGGYGGYDLYYSQMIDGAWSDPVNFGASINSEFDEYRPITLFQDGFENNLMVYSSNREGGKGGYDLYYVGIKQMIE